MNKFDFLILLYIFDYINLRFNFFISQSLKRNSYLSNLLYSFVLLVIKLFCLFLKT